MSVREIKLFVRVRKNNKGSYIASVPLLELKKLAKCNAKHRLWSFKDGWLILEGH